MELRDIGKDDPKIRRFFGSGYVNLMAISLLIIRFIQYGVSRCAVMCSDWQACELCLNYSYGFIKRSLLGTLVSFFANDLNIGYERSIIGLMIMEEIIFTIVLLAFVLYLINKYKDPTLNLCLILLLAMNVAGFYYYDWGEPDLLMISFTLAACLLIVRGKFLWVVPLLASLCVLIHEGFVMMYFGIIIAVLLVKSISGDNNARIKYVSLLIITGFVCSALFIYLHFATQYVINVDVRQLLDKAHQIFGTDNVNCDLLY